MGDYALVTAAVASLAVALATIPEKDLAARLPTTAVKAQALVAREALSRQVSAAQAKAVLARAPFDRAPLRYLYVTGWLDGKRSPASCVFAKATPDETAARVSAAIRRNRRLVGRLARMHVTPMQASGAVVRGTAAAC